MSFIGGDEMANDPQNKLVRITGNNQVAIPSFIVRDLGLQKGVYLQVEEKGRQIVMTPMRLVDEENFAMYEAIVKKGREEYKRGETVDWERVKKKLNRRNKPRKTRP